MQPAAGSERLARVQRAAIPVGLRPSSDDDGALVARERAAQARWLA
jgi:hypothetical protein